ncbi:hypothetical protein LAZ67_4000100 [Cordylochernes scorpioides]|uniref:Ig-like domain-containing protein n=1 Tax=Cordylochernes scorpioides TaxID=51811 RepID=A0ABY6KBZ5_9ARAC|nr:hypothetical protein LAZ67_4000100 [Cordylochernes scorpioides]
MAYPDQEHMCFTEGRAPSGGTEIREQAKSMFTVPEYLSVAGQRISLPCAINTTEEPISLILWYKGDSDVPIYTLDGRRSPLATARHFPALELGNRAHFDVSARPPFLSLDPVEPTDRGDYRCRVDYRRSRTVIRPLRLLVIGISEMVLKESLDIKPLEAELLINICIDRYSSANNKDKAIQE